MALREGCVDVTMANARATGDISFARDEGQRSIGLPIRVKQWSVCCERLFRIVERLEWLELNVDELDRPLSDFQGGRGDSGKRMADETDLVGRKDGQVLDRISVTNRWNISRRDAGAHAWHGGEATRVDTDEARARYATSQNFAV